METTLQYIKNPVFNNTDKDNAENYQDQFKLTAKQLKNNYQQFVEKNNKNAVGDETHSQQKKVQLKIIPQITKKGQIWLCKQKFSDYLGNSIQGIFPYYVLIVREPETLKDSDVEFVRIQPVSMFTEFHTYDDIVVNDMSITGFEFLIETWNEQPVLTSVLNEYIGDLNTSDIKTAKEHSFTDAQKEFRVTEVNNTSYLRQSVLSVLSWLDNKQEKNSGVVINLFNKSYYPEKKQTNLFESKTDLFEINNIIDFPIAAKKSIRPSRDTYQFKQTVNDHVIAFTVIKDEEQFSIVMEQQSGDSELIDPFGGRVKETIRNTKQIFTEITPGLYALKNKTLNTKITIRVQ